MTISAMCFSFYTPLFYFAATLSNYNRLYYFVIYDIADYIICGMQIKRYIDLQSSDEGTITLAI